MKATEGRPERLDEDDPALVRQALVGVTFVAGVLCLLPRQWASGAVCLAVSFGLWIWHRRKSAAAAQRGPAAHTEASR